MKRLADNLANKICLINDIADREKRDIISYGLEIMLTTTVSVLVIIILSVAVKTFTVNNPKDGGQSIKI